MLEIQNDYENPPSNAESEDESDLSEDWVPTPNLTEKKSFIA